ncbi:MAG: hypothetical protein CMM62_00095 [Rhodospirillaceae bacterium]|nr:hypothetical protein [Rhodospirillaceae bacterium]MAX65171.1 hypothetical protein [Rhodospirillaceae bacterium]|tara:strand:+ start:556 stop:879 length:324 start_codon:yes stop_codon:yes gene_type:complete
MATIGTVTFNPEKDEFTGNLTTIAAKASLKIIKNGFKNGDKQPDYRVYANNAECGAAWKKTNQEGGEYISLKIDDPSLPAAIWANLGRAANQDDDDVFALIWERPAR